MSPENRKHPRRYLRRPVSIYLKISTHCTLSDISQTGARLSVDDADTLPDTFMIEINAKLHRWCRVIWRSGNDVGIEFIKPPAEPESDAAI